MRTPRGLDGFSSWTSPPRSTMPTLIFPCSPKSAASHFSYQKKPAGQKKPQDGDGLQKPTKVEYASEAGKGFLDVLETVAQGIPVPGVAIAVKLATNLVKACDESQATLELAEELKRRIRTLATVVVSKWKGTKANEINESLKEDVEVLQNGLQYIEKKLDEINSQHKLLHVFFRSMNEERVTKCMNRLDTLLERFTVARHIDHANLLNSLEREIIGFQKGQNQALNHIQAVVDDINVTVKDVKAIMKTNVPATGPSSSSGTRATIPANKSLFYGRDMLVSDLVERLTNPTGHEKHISILGAGGMGKTSTALTVMANTEIKERYPDSQRVWVPCVKATSGALLLDALASSLGMSQMTGNIKEAILYTLKSSDPLILLLDNFETPWNADDDGRTEAEQTLRDIDQMPHIILFITMRSSTPPCEELSWHSIDLKAVDAKAARQIYSKIYPGSNADSQVPELLELVGHMPLAITLMARSAKLSGLSAKYLINRYKKTGPTMLSQGADREHSMNICIGLSVDSPPMKRNPEAQWLLAALSMLPTGTTYDMLDTWYARDLSNITGALEVLRETSLVELQDSALVVLPVIQRYITDPARFNMSVRHSMIATACQFLEKHQSSPDDNAYQDASPLASEEGNLEAILLQTTTPSTGILNALLELSRYQAVVRPRTNLIAHALVLAQQMGNRDTLGAVLTCYGSICDTLDRFAEARKYYTDAREIYLSMSNTKEAARCLVACIKTYQSDFSVSPEVHDSLSIQAESEFASIGDMHGVAQCWLHRGIAAGQNFSLDDALIHLLRARDKFVELGATLKSAQCARFIALCYYWRQEFEEAKTWSESTVQEFSRVGALIDNARALLELGTIYNALGTHTDALQTLIRCLEQFKVSAGAMHIGLALESIGIAWLQMKKKEDAKGAFQEALQVFPTMPGRKDHARCRFWLKKVDDSSVFPTTEEWPLLTKRYPVKVLSQYGVERE